MRVGQEARQLPGLRKFLLEVRHWLDETGLAILRDIPAPSGLWAALARENLQAEPVHFQPSRLPVDILGEALGTAPELSALLETGLYEFVASIDFALMDAHDIRDWSCS